MVSATDSGAFVPTTKQKGVFTMYVHQLDQKEQVYIQARLQAFFTEEGLTGEELAQAIQNGMDSKTSDLENIHGNTLYNECIMCAEVWNVLEHFGIGDITLDEIDFMNIKRHGQIYCVCDDCGGNNESVLMR